MAFETLPDLIAGSTVRVHSTAGAGVSLGVPRLETMDFVSSIVPFPVVEKASRQDGYAGRAYFHPASVRLRTGGPYHVGRNRIALRNIVHKKKRITTYNDFFLDVEIFESKKSVRIFTGKNYRLYSMIEVSFKYNSLLDF